MTTSAPFTAQQVAALAWLQQGQIFAPYLCPERAVMNDVELHGVKGGRVLTATADGLACPVCGYVRAEVPAAVLAFAQGHVDGMAMVRKKGRGK